jgi:hypothetical protein
VGPHKALGRIKKAQASRVCLESGGTE